MSVVEPAAEIFFSVWSTCRRHIKRPLANEDFETVKNPNIYPVAKTDSVNKALWRAKKSL